MTDQNRNPPAFPNAWTDEMNGQTGMDLRDHFAGQALAGDLASQSLGTGEWANDTPPDFILARAKFYYAMADAMLEARAPTSAPATECKCLNVLWCRDNASCFRASKGGDA